MKTLRRIGEFQMRKLPRVSTLRRRGTAAPPNDSAPPDDIATRLRPSFRPTPFFPRALSLDLDQPLGAALIPRLSSPTLPPSNFTISVHQY